MPTMPKDHKANVDPLQPSEAAARIVFDWLFDVGPASTTITNDNSSLLQCTSENSGANWNTSQAAPPHWFSMVGHCVFCTTPFDLDPKRAKFTVGTSSREMKVIHHCCSVKPVCAQGQKGPVIYTPQAIDEVDLRAIWEGPGSECRSKGPSRQQRSAVASTGTDQEIKFRFNPNFNPGKIGSRRFKFNPESPEFTPDKFNNLEYLNKAVAETRTASAKAPRGSIEKRNAETRCIAALKKRSRYLIAERTRQQEESATSDHWDA
ncbi:hypothetical protein FN846DRAFT_895710 [Sphaerosporella brunnea]|uniref:Uncharacterized protein n=1 Tax=Sphaerosporella brunnea TaxID=1250544 RepID=A0A5J5EDQ4_9PEZI|nr:hypothetical protein FN846DRAFT_895710 [Sphaerosporella brunnea]